MNSYLQLKCRSEQQVMNDLSRCVAAKDVKKLGGLLHELSFFYVSVVADGDGYIHDTVLKDLSAILMLVKDKKEDQKIVRLVEILLQRIAEQMLYTIGNSKLNHGMRAASTPRGDNTGAIMVQLAALMDMVAKYEISHALQPRRVAAYRLYVVLCNVLQQPERCFSLVSGIPASSAWTMLALSSTSKKKGSDKELPAQLALLNASFQIARSLVATSPNLLEPLLPQLVSGAFIPNRHAAAACLTLFDIMPLKVIDALMAHVSPASVSINTTDPLAACYILKLCGKIVRLPVGNRKSSTTATNLLDFSFDAKPIKREEKVPVGPAIEQHISNRIQDLLLDVCTQRSAFSLGYSNSSLSNCSILLTAIEEMTLGQIAPKCFEKVRGGHSAFEIAANGIYTIMQTHASNPIVLHRVCRAIQSVAASFDLTLVEFSDHHLDFFSKITDMVWDISLSIEVYHPCLIKESLIALVWLLPRNNVSSPSRTPAKGSLPTPWVELLPQLLQLTYVSNVERYDILQALYRRATHFDIDVSLLTHAMTILLHWYQTSPCQWHGDMFLMLWQSMFTSDKCFRSFTNPTDIFQSILTVLDHHKAHDDFGLQAVQYTKCITISFVSSTKVLADPSFTSSCVDVILRLAKFAMTEDWPVRRTSIQALIDLLDLCQVNPIALEHVCAILFGLKDKAPMQGYCDILYPVLERIQPRA